jgi:hypothetical protein
LVQVAPPGAANRCEGLVSRVLTALLGLMVLAPPAVFAGGIGLSWDDCVAPLPAVKHFACNTNTGFDNLIGSFEPYVGIPDVTGVQATIDLVFRDGIVPSWWQTGVGGCRLAGLSVTGVFSDQQTACTDPWQGQALNDPVMVEPAFGGNPARLRITVSLGVPVSAAFSVAPGTVYYAYRLQIRHTATVGSGSCSGCDVPALIMPYETRLTTVNSGDNIIANLIDTGIVCWQCDCGLYSEGGGAYFGTCAATPALNRTWGGIKSLYR